MIVILTKEDAIFGTLSTLFEVKVRVIAWKFFSVILCPDIRNRFCWSNQDTYMSVPYDDGLVLGDGKDGEKGESV